MLNNAKSANSTLNSLLEHVQGKNDPGNRSRKTIHERAHNCNPGIHEARNTIRHVQLKT
jgi:hypothetical protein